MYYYSYHEILQFLTFLLLTHSLSVTQKVRKGGFRSALRAFLIFGSALDPKSRHFPPIDEVYRHMLENHLMLPYFIRRQYLFVDFHWSQYLLYYVAVDDPFIYFSPFSHFLLTVMIYHLKSPHFF